MMPGLILFIGNAMTEGRDHGGADTLSGRHPRIKYASESGGSMARDK
jgi:hypothetical protein